MDSLSCEDRRVWVLLALFLVLCPLIMGKSFEEDLTITRDQKIILEKFRSIMESRLPHDYMRTDAYLMRWLRARNWKLPEAETYLMKNLRWRKENNIDNVHSEDWSDLKNEFQYFLESRDKEGKPLLYLDVGGMDVRKSFLSGKIDRFMRFTDKALDEACGLVRELGQKYKNVSQGILMINLNGFNLVQHGCVRCVPVILRIVISYENHYPGCADKIILVNTPAIAQPLIEAGRSLLQKETNDALKIYGTNKGVWMKELLQYFELDQLPRELGGTKVYAGLENDY